VAILVLRRTERFQPKVVDDEPLQLAEVPQAPFVCAIACAVRRLDISWFWVMKKNAQVIPERFSVNGLCLSLFALS